MSGADLYHCREILEALVHTLGCKVAKRPVVVHSGMPLEIVEHLLIVLIGLVNLPLLCQSIPFGQASHLGVFSCAGTKYATDCIRYTDQKKQIGGQELFA